MSEALAVEYSDVTFRYPGLERPALERVTLGVSVGERLGILGPNGGGKSTLLKLTLGLLKEQGGSIRVFGRTPREARRAGLVGYVPQRVEIERAFPMSVREVVMMGAGWRTPPWRRVSRAVVDRVDRLLGLVGVGSLADRPVGALSGGQLQRVMIARALAPEARVLALDEPTVGIDAEGQRRLGELLQTLHAELGVTILLVSHDLRAIVAGCDRVACLSRTLHRHVTPAGLTPDVLGELFSHNVEGLFGALHVHAHPAGECPLPHDGSGLSGSVGGESDAGSAGARMGVSGHPTAAERASAGRAGDKGAGR